MISWAGLCQTKGFGSWFQRSTQISIASMRAGTLEKAPRRSRRSVISLNYCSTRLSHESRSARSAGANVSAWGGPATR